MTLLPILRRTSLFAGLACLLGVAFATLSPIELRPHMAETGIEHIAAFLMLGLLLGLAYPRQLLIIGAGLLLAAIGLEAAQFLVPGRHGRVIDLVQKAIGSGIGLTLAATADLYLRRFSRVEEVGSSATSRL